MHSACKRRLGNAPGINEVVKGYLCPSPVGSELRWLWQCRGFDPRVGHFFKIQMGWPWLGPF